jgi:NAD(P)-dependent dehydrogenase (short-subunit alcohol dehydrogenase family)
VSATSELLCDGPLEGIAVLVVDAGEGSSFGRAVAEGAEQVGARVRTSMPDVVLAEPDAVDILVVDGAALFASGGLGACLEGAWEATAAVVNGAFLPVERGGRIVYLAPAPGAGKQADAARAGLENLARTLSVEWARHQITVVTIALGDTTAPGEAAALTAYLASPAGAYFSGCQLDLRGASEPSTRRRPASSVTRVP